MAEDKKRKSAPAKSQNTEKSERAIKREKKKAAKEAAPKKPNIFKRMAKYFRDVKGEFKRIVWPTKKTVINNSLVVLATVAIVAVVVWGLDAVFALIRSLLINNL